MDDLLTVETMPVETRGASMTVRQKVLRGEEELVAAEVKVVCVGEGRARRIPTGSGRSSRVRRAVDGYRHRASHRRGISSG